MSNSAPTISPTVSVDAVIFQLLGNALHVMLMRRAGEPFSGAWELPGGHNAHGETTLHALERTIQEKIGISFQSDLRYNEQLYTFDRMNEDSRGHAVSVTYTGYGREIVMSDNEDIAFFPVSQLPDMAFDHADIIRYAHDRLSAKLSYTNVVYAFLPKTFTLAELQAAYEAVFECVLDKRNFRKKFLSLNLIHETTEMKRVGAHRPARLYTFNTQAIESLPRGFVGLFRNKN